MTRHQRRKRAKLRLAAQQRQEIVRSNLSTPATRDVLRGSLVSGIYRGEIGRARGMGAVPMTHKVWAVIADRPEVARVLYPAGTRIIRRK